LSLSLSPLPPTRRAARAPSLTPPRPLATLSPKPKQQVYNLTTYPHLVGFLDALNVDTEPSDMSFSLSLDEGALEWSSVRDLDSVFAQRTNALSPSFLRMVADVVRFGREAPSVLLPENSTKYRDVTLGQFLDEKKYGQAFRLQYVLPMCAAVWSVPQSQAEAFPVQMLVRFWINHHLLDLTQRPKWRVVKDRSRSYVNAVLKELPDVRTSTSVVGVERLSGGGGEEGVLLRFESSSSSSSSAAAAAAAPPATPPRPPLLSPLRNKQQQQQQQRRSAAGEGEETFDAVVLATHSDVTLRLLGNGATPEEREVLGSIPYGDNDVWLHTDASLMPRLRKTWASWNFLGRSAAEDKGEQAGGSGAAAATNGNHHANGNSNTSAAVCVTYWLNNLQRLGESAPDLFCTLNPIHPPKPESVVRRLTLSHPIFSMASARAQERLPSLQGKGNVYFAGAWCGYGFHEDGIKAAVDVCARIGAGPPPWGANPLSPSPKLSLSEHAYLSLFDRFARAAIRKGDLRMILPNGDERRYGDGDVAPARTSAAEAWRALPERRATLRVFSAAMFRKVAHRHDVGLGEAYMDRDFEVDDLGGFLAIVVSNARELEGKRGVLADLGDKLLNLAHRARSNTREGSRRNIEEHYDAGNDMYSLFLDETMTYSCGIHGPGVSLKDAQIAKLDAVIEAAGLTASDHVLEIGCGWGSFAMRAASTRGCRVTGLTLSKEQLAEATKRVKAAGLEDRVRLLYCDYRDCKGPGGMVAGAGGAANGNGNDAAAPLDAASATATLSAAAQSSSPSSFYDAVVSIEMIEAVGHEHLVSYFQAIGRLLKPGGKAVIQVISQPDERYASYCRGSDFIREHIFPGGHLPSMGAMVDAARGTGLAVRAVRDIGPDYAVTLREWRFAWELEQEAALALGYSQRFWRKYHFYFAYCEAAFDARYIHDWHVTWVKEVDAGGEGVAGAIGEAEVVGGEASALAAVKRANTAQRRRAAAAASAAAGLLPEDPWTQALLTLYAFLAGVLVSRHPVLWSMPAASAACAVLMLVAGGGGGDAAAVVAVFGLAAAAASALFWSRVPGLSAAAWSLYALVRHGSEGAPGGAGGLMAAATSRGRWRSAVLAAAGSSTRQLHQSTPLGALAAGVLAAGRAEQPLAGALCAAAAGFFAWRLWLTVRQRRLAAAAARWVGTGGSGAGCSATTDAAPQPTLAAVARDALLLLAFGVAAVLPEEKGPAGGRAFLAAALLGQAAPAVAALRQLVVPASGGGATRKALLGLEAVALLVASVIPRALLLGALLLALSGGGGEAASALAGANSAGLQRLAAGALRAGLAVAVAGDAARLVGVVGGGEVISA
jgi:predicted NAD/FAD-binding protein/cyclopropane fatty-acyl-phospholipid synthase-like methyltransferase